MKFSSQAIILLVAVCAVLDTSILVAAKKPSRPSSASRRGPSRSGTSRSSGRASVSKRSYDDDDEDDYAEIGFDDPFEDEADEGYEEEDEYMERSSQRSSSRKNNKPSRPSSRKKAPPSRSRYEEESDDEYDRHRRAPRGRQPPSRRGAPPSRRGPPGRGRGRGSVVPYTRQQKPSTFTRGLEAFKNSMPDPSTVRNAALNSLNAARESTSSLSANLYREVKGLTSSELEQVMLKATRPDDTAVKGKHAERLVGVTYQISARYDIYDAVLRKLWSKMAEKDWRTTIKALYILHRFSADGAPEHAPALKARLRELRRTRDPKRKDKFFNSKQLLAGDNKPESAKFRAFMSRYAHYVLLRAQCFGGMFDEIATEPSSGKDKKKTKQKPITSTSLRTEHLDAAGLLLKAGIACQLKDGEACENTAIAVERVASDLIGLTSAVAKALNRALEGDDMKGADPKLIKRWCEFYGEDLFPQCRSMVKRTTPKLDAFGLFLPSRMGTSVSQDLLQKGLKLEEEEDVAAKEENEVDDSEMAEEKKVTSGESEEEENAPEEDEDVEEEEDDDNEYDEYEYDVEEYYDDEEPF